MGIRSLAGYLGVTLAFVCVVCVSVYVYGCFVIAVEMDLDSTYFRVLLLFG